MSDFKDFGGDFFKYLAETEILDFSSASIVRLVEARGWKNLRETEKIKSIYKLNEQSCKKAGFYIRLFYYKFSALV